MLKYMLQLVVILFFMGNQYALAQTCVSTLRATTPTSDFTIHDNGTVTHNVTGLMWMRCSLGQTWNQDTQKCGGSASGYTWVDALTAAGNNETAEHTNWRLPNRNELLSIIEARCHSPAVNSDIFPNIPNTNNGNPVYWSATPDFQPGASNSLTVLFGNGLSSPRGRNNGAQHARLVRDIE